MKNILGNSISKNATKERRLLDDPVIKNKHAWNFDDSRLVRLSGNPGYSILRSNKRKELSKT